MAVPWQSTPGKDPEQGSRRWTHHGAMGPSPARALLPHPSPPDSQQLRTHTLINKLFTQPGHGKALLHHCLWEKIAEEFLIRFSKGAHLQQRHGLPPTETTTSQDESASEYYMGTEQ